MALKPPPARLLRALDGADPAIRLYLFHGPDEAGARALAARLGPALGADSERVDLTGAELRADPARLADEAAAIAMFGGRRWIRVDPAGDDALAAVKALLETPAAGNPVAIVAPSLRRDAKLVKLAEAADAALVHVCYLPDEGDLDALAAEHGRTLGLALPPDVATALARSAGGDRAILAREVEKLALYLDAAPDRPRAADRDDLDAIGVPDGEADLGQIAVAVFGGDLPAVEDGLARLGHGGIDGMALLRILSRRALLLAQLRSQVEAGDGIDRVIETAGKSIFFKEKRAVRRALGLWDAAALATVTARLGAAERGFKSAGYIGEAATGEEVLAIARHAARRQ